MLRITYFFQPKCFALVRGNSAEKRIFHKGYITQKSLRTIKLDYQLGVLCLYFWKEMYGKCNFGFIHNSKCDFIPSLYTLMLGQKPFFVDIFCKDAESLPFVHNWLTERYGAEGHWPSVAIWQVENENVFLWASNSDVDGFALVSNWKSCASRIGTNRCYWRLCQVFFLLQLIKSELVVVVTSAVGMGILYILNYIIFDTMWKKQSLVETNYNRGQDDDWLIGVIIHRIFPLSILIEGPDLIAHRVIGSFDYSSKDLKTHVSFWILLLVSLQYMLFHWFFSSPFADPWGTPCNGESSVHPLQTPEGLRVKVTLQTREWLLKHSVSRWLFLQE